MKQKKIYSGIVVGSALVLLSACGGEVKPEANAEVEKTSIAKEEKVEPAKVAEKKEPVKPMPTVVKPVEKKQVISEVVAPDTADPQKVAAPVKKTPVVKPAVASNTGSQAAKLNARNPTKNRIGSAKELKQKVSYSRMMFMSKSSKRVAASNNDDAKAMLTESKEKMNQARVSLDGGDLQAAQTLINDSMRMFNAAAILVPSEAVIAEQRKRYTDLVKVLEANRATHQENFDRMVKKDGKEAGVEYDAEQVDVLVHEASKLAAEKDYISAAATVDSANRMVNSATSEMLHDQTITYEINVDTPEGEWAYELDRFLGYEELIPVAMENKKPKKSMMFLINRNIKKSEKMANKARETAAAGDYPRAIAMILDATKEVRKALRLMGVKQ